MNLSFQELSQWKMNSQTMDRVLRDVMVDRKEVKQMLEKLEVNKALGPGGSLKVELERMQ